MTQFLRLLIEELVRQSDLDSRQAQHLKIYIDDADNHPNMELAGAAASYIANAINK